MINLEEGNLYFGFRLQKVSEIKDIDSIGYLFFHEKSGARLFYIKNQDDNKVFFVSFKTPPENNCGTAHIMEHSVLCGSKKYPLKDPFNELAKGSLNTYLNAMTFSDKTMYPIASRNEKDFDNLMYVYLDAVFCPLIYERKEIFMQEGWHYHIEEEKEPIIYKGVVYNEMKGALSNPERILANTISKSLFPHSIYQYESGGDPEAIPNLSYEEFLNFHKKYYHPSNSFFYLYGDLHIEEKLNYLNEEYLSHYDLEENKIEIKEEKQFEKKVLQSSYYPVSSKEEEINNTFLSYNVKIGKSTDSVLSLAFTILDYILLSTDASPLKKALIEAKIAQDVEGWFDSSTYEMTFSIVAKKSEFANQTLFEETIENCLKNLVKNGIDKKLLESSFNVWEFHFREENFSYRPKGLVYGTRLMKSWLHGADPTEALKQWEQFYFVKEVAQKENYFEKLIEVYILNNQNKSIVSLIPKYGQQSTLDKQAEKSLDDYKKQLSENQLKEMIKETKNLLQYQSEKESQEDLKKIPLLNLSEVNKKAEFLDTEKKDTMLHVYLPTNGIIYMRLLFFINTVPHQLLPYAGLLSDILSKMDTLNYSYETLSLEIDEFIGNLSFSCESYSKNKDDFTSVFMISSKALEKNLTKMIQLLSEIITNTSFSNVERLKNLVKEIRVKQKRFLLNNAHSIAVSKSISHFSSGSQIKEETSGIIYYYFLLQLEKDLEIQPEIVIENLKETLQFLFAKDNLFCVAGAENKAFEKIEKGLKDFSERLKDKKKKAFAEKFDFFVKREAFTAPLKVQYNVQSADYKQLGYDYCGAMQVAKTIINREYLWNEVRVKGGAYGCSCNILKNGNLYIYSYRDPNLKKTFQAYHNISEFLQGFQADERQMTKYILGSINLLDKPKHNEEKVDIAVARYLCGIQNKDLQKEREEILSSVPKEINNFAQLFEKAMNENNICTIGNELTVLNEKQLFEKITEYIKE